MCSGIMQVFMRIVVRILVLGVAQAQKTLAGPYRLTPLLPRRQPRLILQDAEGKELVNKRVCLRGNLIFRPYQGNITQRRQEVSSFSQRLREEIEKLK